MDNRYYYSICNELEKDIYTCILEGLLDYQDIIYINSHYPITSAMVGTIFKMVLYDNPKIFYTSTQGCMLEQTGASVRIRPKYFFSAHSTVELLEWLDERITEICTPILHVEDQFSKEIFIHNYLIQNVNYSASVVSQPVNAYTVVGTLLENNSVCAGVALSFKLLMDYLGVPCIVVTGITTNESGNSEHHAWNLVSIDHSYYQVDATWDLLNGQDSRIIKYDYFNLTSSEMYQSRIPDHEYPPCTSHRYNYFSYTESIVHSPGELVSYVIKQIHLGENRIYFKYTFDSSTMKDNLKYYLKKVPFLGAYRYWINETTRTVFIMRI